MIRVMAEIDTLIDKQKAGKKSRKPIDPNEDDDLSKNLEFVQEIKVEAWSSEWVVIHSIVIRP